MVGGWEGSGIGGVLRSNGGFELDFIYGGLKRMGFWSEG